MDKEKQTGKKADWKFYVQITAVIVLVGLLMFSFGKSSSGSVIKTVSASEIIPHGVPDIYGSEIGVEIGVSFNDISANNKQLADSTIRKLSQYESLKLNSDLMQRYIKIGSSISCEYCCGAKALVFSNGERACGCAHSAAMRGLAKYLLKNHPDMSNLEILSELGKWKVLFFPGPIEKKAQILESKGIDSKNYVNLASNLYRGIEKGQTNGGMVGGC